MKVNKILIIGGAGFIGSNLCLSLAKDFDVWVIDNCKNNNYKKNEEEINKPIGKKFLKENILNKNIDFFEWFNNSDVVFNLVGNTSHINSIKNPNVDIEDNILAPFKVLELSKEICPEAKIIYTGTRGQYGKIKYLPVDENHPIDPVDVNGISKQAAEQYHILYSKLYNMDIISLRLTNIFGPRYQTKTPDGVLNWFITQALRGEKISICGGDRDILYIDECIDALVKTMNLDKSYSGNVFNIGGRKVSLKEYVEILSRVVKIDFEIMKKEYKLEIGDYLADYSKFNKATGWKPSNIELKEMITETVDFYKVNGL